MATQLQLSEWMDRTRVDEFTLFQQLYCEVADATPLDEAFAASTLIGQLPTLQHYTPGYQREVIMTLMKRMVALEAPADGLTRCQKRGMYMWRLSNKE